MVAAVGVATCRIGDLITVKDTALLVVEPAAPDSLKASSALGSVAPQVRPINVKNDGGGDLHWRAFVKNNSPWVTLDPDSGTAGQTPTLQALFHPSGLAIGEYEDTVVVQDRAGTGTLEVPLWYQVRSCDLTTITLPDSDSSILTSADCGAPHRQGRFARVYQINNGTSVDSVTIEVTAAYDAYVVFGTSLAATAPPLKQSDNCLGAGRDPCLYYIKLPRDGVPYYVEVTSADSADTGAFKVRVLRPRPPSAPDSLSQRVPADSTTPVIPGGVISQQSIVLRAVVSDPDLGDTLQLQAEVQPVGTSFTNFANWFSAKVPNDSPAYVLVTGLNDNTSYHWRVRAADQTGRVTTTWSTFADPAFNVQAGHDPTFANANQYQSNGTTVIFVGDTANGTTVIFKAQLSDIDFGNQLTLQVEVKDVVTGFDSVTFQQSGPVSSGGTAQATVSAPTLVAGHNYHWQARVVDNTGRPIGRTGWASFGGNAESATDFHVNQPPQQLNWVTQPGNSVAGSAISGPPQVAVQDQNGVTITGFNGPVTMAITTRPTGGQVTLLGTTTVNAAGGVAPFPNLIIDTAGVGYRLRATAGTINSAESNLFNVTAAPVTQLVFTVQPANAVAGVNIAPPIKVSAEDQFSNVNASFTGSVAMTIAFNAGNPPGTLGGSTTATASAGVATFSSLNIDKTGVGYKLRAGATGLTPDTSLTFNITPGPATLLVFSGQPNNASANATITPPVQVSALDANNNLATGFISNVTVAIGANPPGNGILSGTKTIPAAAGIATFSILSIDKTGTSYTLTAAATGLTGATSNFFDIVSSTVDPNQSTVVASPGTITASNGSSQSTITVTARDNSGNPVSGASTTISVTGAGNTVTPAGAVITNGSGVATWTLSSTASGVKTASAIASSISITQTAPVTVNAGPATTLAFTPQPATTTAGVAINAGSGGVMVTARDAFLNTATSFGSTVTMVLGANPAGGVLTGTLTAPASAGVATFGNLRIIKAGNNYQLQASGGALTSPLSNAFNINAAPAHHLLFTTPIVNTAVLAKIDSATGGVVVVVQDSVDNTVPFGGTVRVIVGNPGMNPGGGALTGGTAITAPLGTATFQNLTLNALGTGYTLQTTSSGPALIPDESNSFDIIPGPAKTLNFTVQPTQTVAGQVISPAVQVTARDIQGNTATGFTGNVTMAIGTNGGSPAGTLSGTLIKAAAAGVATFSNLSINNAGPTSYTLTAATPPLPSGSVTGGTSAPFNVVAGGVSPTLSTITRSPTQITASSGTITSTITVTANDGLGNPIQGLNVVLAATGTNNTLTQPAAPTNASGIATGTLASTVAETKTISATIDAVPINATTTVVVNPANPFVLGFFKNPPASVTAGTAIAPAVQVEVRDAFNNRVTNAPNLITLTVLQAGRGTPSNNTATPSGGIATFSTLSIDKATTTGVTQLLTPDSLIANATGLVFDTSTGFAVNPAAASASQSTVGAAPGTITASNGSSASTITVTAKDQFGNLIQGATVVLAASPITGNTLTQPGSTTNSSGVATGTLSTTKAESKTVSATANGVAITQTATVTVNAAAASASQSTVGAAPGTITASNGSSASTITVTAKDQFGNLIQGATVVLAASPITGNTLTQPGSTTNSSGVATGTLSTTKAESKTVSATANGVAITQTATVTVNAAAASASQSTVGAAPGTITASNGSSASTITVTAKDQFGNLIQGATVVLAASPTTGNTLTQPGSTTNSSGVATGTLSSTKAESKTLSATANGVAITQTGTVTITAAAASQLIFTVDASNTQVNTAMSPAVVVTALDQFGNVATGFTGEVVMTFGTDPTSGAAALTYTAPVNAVFGVATFSDLMIDVSDNGYTLAASAAGLSGATSGTFNVTP